MARELEEPRFEEQVVVVAKGVARDFAGEATRERACRNDTGITVREQNDHRAAHAG